MYHHWGININKIKKYEQDIVSTLSEWCNKGLVWQNVFITWEYLDVSNPAGVTQVVLNRCDSPQKEQQLISIATNNHISHDQ